MAIPARGGDFKRAKAPEGRSNVVCVDVWDPGAYKANGDPSDSPDGMVEKRNGKTGVVERKYMLNVVFVVGDRNGNPLRDEESGWLITVSQRFNNSLYDTAHLRKFIEQWLNGKRKLTPEQVKTLEADLERPLLGKTGEASIVHNGDYANLDWVEKLPEGYVPMRIPEDYVRVQDRAAQRQRDAQQDGGQPRQQQNAAPPAHAAPNVNANAFAQTDDVFGAAPPQQQAQPTYDTYRAPPLGDGRTPEEMDPNHPAFLPF